MKKLILLILFIVPLHAELTDSLQTDIKVISKNIDSIKKDKSIDKAMKKVIMDSLKKEKSYRQESIIYEKSKNGVWTDKSGQEWYQGERVYTGPRGGRYYMNSNGNKTYIR